MDEPLTATLVSGAQSGDTGARDALYERYFQRVLSIVRVRMGGLLRSRMESQDLVQSVMLESLKDLGAFEYRTEGAFLHWLSTLAERKIRDKVDYLGAQKRNASRETSIREEPSANRSHSPSGLVAQAEELLRLEEGIRTLPKDQAELVVMSKLEGLSHQEIARMTGKTPDAVRMAVARAVLRLSEAMGA